MLSCIKIKEAAREALTENSQKHLQRLAREYVKSAVEAYQAQKIAPFIGDLKAALALADFAGVDVWAFARKACRKQGVNAHELEQAFSDAYLYNYIAF